MARIPRRRLGRGVYHVINRAVDPRWVLADDAAKTLFLDGLVAFAEHRPLSVYHWCLMANHFHLAVEAVDVRDLGYVIGQTCRRFALAHHRRHGGSGYLWQGRFRCILVQTEGYLGRLGQYLERNPLAACVPGVGQASDYRWSSARAYVMGEPDPLVEVANHPEWARMGQTDAERRACYARHLLTERDRAAEHQLFAVPPADTVGDAAFLRQARRTHGARTGPPPQCL
jgi:putative transposase